MGSHNQIRYDTRCYFNVRSKANISQLNLPHGKTAGKKSEARCKHTVSEVYYRLQSFTFPF